MRSHLRLRLERRQTDSPASMAKIKTKFILWMEKLERNWPVSTALLLLAFLLLSYF